LQSEAGAPHNGQVATIVGFLETKGRYSVKYLSDPKEGKQVQRQLSLKPANILPLHDADAGVELYFWLDVCSLNHVHKDPCYDLLDVSFSYPCGSSFNAHSTCRRRTTRKASAKA